MTKEQLLDALSKTCDSRKQAGDVLDKFTSAVTEALAKEEEVRLTGFGTFSISHRKARTGVNPRTGQKIQIAAAKLPKFKAGKALKDAVR